MSQPAHINTFYRLWFTWFDPLVIAATVCAIISNPAESTEMLVPASVSPFQPLQAAILYQCAPLFGFMGIMFGVLLRASNDPKVWRIVQAATLVVDVSLIAIMVDALRVQGRLEVERWRGIERFNIAFTLAIALGRVAFLMGLGGKGKALGKKEL